MPGRASAEAGGPKPRAAQPTSCAVCGENLSRAGKYVADRRIIGVRLVFGDVAHGIADLFERDANAATLLDIFTPALASMRYQYAVLDR